ncbi:asparagine synthase-related protein [Streptomyces aureoversilis]|uniref:Asparagine synthase-related protein n=1 Tax=Streptomyces aureoversilis TaxID=67277 RepID=A0ABW0A5I0_9ACTN
MTTTGLSSCAARLARANHIDEVERFVDGPAGSFHLVAWAGGRGRVRGSASAVRRVFHARVGGVTVASDRCDVLAEVIGAPVDERVLAARLPAAGAVHSLDGRSIRRGVTAVPPDHCLLVEPDGRAVLRRWWQAPEPTLPLKEGAAALRGALSAAVDSCTAGGGTVSADLSGGLDSTSLCLLAARGPARLVTVHREATDPANDDADWTRRAVAALRALPALPGAEHQHQHVGRDRIPLWFAGVNDSSYPPWEEPGTWVRDRARLGDLTRRMTAAGSRLHLTGYGGDELFTLTPRCLHDLVREHPFKAPAYIRAHRLRLRQPLTPLLRALAERTTYARWLTRAADQLTTPLSEASAPAPSLAWGPVLRMPPWATAEAVRYVQELLREASEAQAHEATPGATDPLARQRAQHAAILYARATGSAVRRLDQATGRAGLPLAAPCLDDAVMDAVLSVRLHDRAAEHGVPPTANKPVLLAAMRGIVPDPLLARTTKGDYSADFYAALRRHRGELLDLFEGSLLAGMGLIDPEPLRAALLGPHPTTHILTSLSRTVACETWLRAGVRPGLRAGVPSCDGTRSAPCCRASSPPAWGFGNDSLPSPGSERL